jgi:hypothetical protein
MKEQLSWWLEQLKWTKQMKWDEALERFGELIEKIGKRIDEDREK